MKKIYLWLLLITTFQLSYSQITIVEGFDGATTPTGWTYTGFIRSTAAPCVSTASLRRNFYSTTTGSGSVLSPNQAAASNGQTVTFSFDWKSIEYSVGSGINGTVDAQYSVDNGTNWVTLGTITANSITTCGTWTQTIPAGTIPNGSDFKIRLLGTWISGDYYIYIDNVNVTQPVSSPPACPANVTATQTATCGNYPITFSWNTAVSATGYKLKIGTTPGGSDILNNVDLGNVTSYVYSSATISTTYYYTAVAYNSQGDSTGCTEQSFTTPSTGCHCVSVPTSNDGAGVTNVKINTTDFPTTDVTYVFHSSPVVAVYRGIATPVNITFATGYTYDSNVWIDFNDNYVFEASELLVSGMSAAPNPSTLMLTMTPSATANLGVHRMRIGTADDGQATPNPCYSGAYGVTLDFDVEIKDVPADMVDWANIQFVEAAGNMGTAVTSINKCETVNIYSQTYEPTVTNASSTAAGAGIRAWIGISTSNTDPATWPESAWTAATYNADSGNNDEYKVSFSNLAVGTHYIASRYSLNFGAYNYGATNNGFWNATNNPNFELTVTENPTIDVAAVPNVICAGAQTTLTASSTNPNFTYSWDNGAGSGASVTVSPAATTTYTVTATDSVTDCVFTKTVMVIVTPLPNDFTLTPSSPQNVCANTIVSIAATNTNNPGSGKIGTGTTGTTTISPFKGWFGSQKTQTLYTAADLIGLGIYGGDKITSIGYTLLGGTPIQQNDFTVKVGLVSDIEFAAATFLPSPSTVIFTDAAYVPPTGTGNIDFPLSTPLVWDGTSSLLVETCFNNNNNGGLSSNNLSVEYTTKTTYQTVYDSADSTADNCSDLTADLRTLSMPNLRVSYENVNQITWSPATNLYTDASATTAYTAGDAADTVYFKATTGGTNTYTVKSSSVFGCFIEKPFVVNVTSAATPTGPASQTFCASDNPTTEDLDVTGSNLQFYTTDIVGIAPIPVNAPLENGTTYYVSQTVGTCESDRLAITVTIHNNVAPTGNANQDFCSTSGHTLQNLSVTGTGLKWYNAATGGTLLPNTTVLANGVTYYVSQTVGTCESGRIAITVNDTCLVGIEEITDGSNLITIYPNPVKEVLYFNSEEQVVSTKVFDLSGKLVLENNNITTNQVNVSVLREGTYILKATLANGKVETEKFLKK